MAAYRPKVCRLKLTNNNYWHEVKLKEYKDAVKDDPVRLYINILEIREIWDFRTFVAEANHGKTLKSIYRWLIFPQVPFS